MDYEMHPDRGYRDTLLWVPKSRVNTRMLRYSLTLPGTQRRAPITLWEEKKHHIGIPRERFGLDHPWSFEVEDRTPIEFPRVSIKSSLVLDALDQASTLQQDAYEDLTAADSGILNLGCGSGKSPLMLHAIAQWGVPALIIVNLGHLLSQWREEIERFLELDGPIGKIQGKPSKWSWEGCPIVLASLKTLTLYADQIPAGLNRHFGVVVFDEAHHLGAPQYSTIAGAFLGRRYGLTATVTRPDGMELIYLWHLGPVIHRNLDFDLVPEVQFVHSGTAIDWGDSAAKSEYCDRFGEVHIQRLCAYVGQRPEELTLAQHVIGQEVAAGRDILALSVSKGHSRALHSLYPDSGMIDADVGFEERLRALHDHRLTFATVQIAREAINKRRLDTLILLTEFSSDNNLQQAIGRVLRKYKDKAPKVIVLSHDRVPPMRAMGLKLRQHFRGWGMETIDVQPG